MDKPASRSANDNIASPRLANRDYLSGKELAALDAVVTVLQTIDAGAVLSREGEPTDSLYVLTVGWACRYKTTLGGARQMPALVVPGDICNLDSLMFSSMNYGVRTLSPAVVMTLPRERALALSMRHPCIAGPSPGWHSSRMQSSANGRCASAASRHGNVLLTCFGN